MEENKLNIEKTKHGANVVSPKKLFKHVRHHVL